MKAVLHDMIFYGFHGVHPEERTLGQRFIVTISFESDHSKDQQIRHLHDTVDYSRVYADVKHIMEKKQFELLEACANDILDELLQNYPKIESAEVSIKKPSVPLNGPLNSVEVVMKRSRK